MENHNTIDMENSTKHNQMDARFVRNSNHPVGICTQQHRTRIKNHIGKLLLLLCLLLVGRSAFGQTTVNNCYVFYNGTYGYLYNNNGTLASNGTFRAASVWIASGAMGTTNRSLLSYTNRAQYLVGSSWTNGADVSIGNSSNVWQTRDGYLATNNNYYSYYLQTANGTTFTTRRNNYNQRYPPTAITVTEYPAINNTTGGLSSVGLSAANISYGGTAVTATLTSPALNIDERVAYTEFLVSGNHYYWWNNADQTAAPTRNQGTIVLTRYEWSLSGAGATYLSLANTTTTGLTNTITYTTPNPNANATATITVKAIYADGTEISKTNTITVNQYTANPTDIDADDISFYVGETTTINPTLTCDIPDYPNIYRSLSYTSANTGIATVNATTGLVTAVAQGTTTITITAALQGGGTITKTIDVTVAERAAAPTISFDNTTGELTMSSTTPGAEIHYTINGVNPTSSSLTYNASSKPVLTQGATVKAITTASGYIASNITTLTVEQVATPTVTVSGTTVNLVCATNGVTYYYTTDGSEPTLSSTSTTSTSLTTFPSGSTIKVMAAKNGMVTSEVASKYIELTLSTPTITIAGGQVTMTSSDGATIHYTTDGSEPTASSPTYTAPLTPTNGVTYKAIAIKAGYVNSEIAEERYMISSGVSGSTVTINDYEDHNWTYYQSSENLPDGYPAYLSSPDPRNVKITYRGGSVNNASAVAISGLTGEDQNEMVYYKTLEKTVLGMTGNYPYQVISNPFSKRPRTNGSTGTNGYFGFAGWKVISGGEYIQEYANNAVIPLDAIIHFTNLDNNYTPNCTSGEVIFEATWTAATVKTGTTAQTFTGGTYETNFWVITGNLTGNTALSIGSACTMMAMNPDGTTGYYNTYTIQRAITAGTDNVKLEWVKFNSTGAIDANGKTFTIGRGVVQNGTGGPLYGINSDNNCANTVKIESGKYSLLHNFNAGISSNKSVDQLMILGCDYDRANNDNTKLYITGEMYVGKGVQLNRTTGTLYVRGIIKSGNFISEVDPSGSSYSGAGGDQTYYFSVGNTHNSGRRFLTVEGGRLAGIAGGMDETNGQSTTGRSFDLRVRGTALIEGVVFGAAEYANGKGTRTMIFTGGTVNGWVAGGANGTQTSNGALNGASYIYVGGNAQIDSKKSTKVMNRSVGGNVYGAGCGYSANSSSGQVQLGTNLVLADGAYVERGLYGGGGFGYCTNTQTSNIFITGGHVGGYTGNDYNNATIQGGVYGGARQNQGGSAFIYMTGGFVETGVYGGSNNSGTMNGSVTMQINGGQVGTSTTPGNIHGGGYGQNTVINHNVDITLGKTGSARDANGVTVWGDVYGGSALGSVNGTAAINTYHTNVTMNAGYIHGSLYGGALGSNTVAANVYGPVQVKVYGGSVMNTDGTGANGSGAVYGANNVNGAPQRSVTVDIYGTNSAPAEGEYALFSVYGGGNQANYTYGNGYPKVTVHNCDNSIEYVYGGGNAAAVAATDVTIYGGNKIGNVFGGGNGQVTAANVTGNTNVKIYGGIIGDVYGGSNTNGTIGGTITVNVNAQAEAGHSACAMEIDNVYSGGNRAASNVGQLTIGCTGDGFIRNVYGGANQADITGNISLNITGGNIGNVFGGNNNSGDISGNITVTVNWNNSCDSNSLTNVYGGGNKAAYGHNNNYPVVNIYNATIDGDVFGGGLGSSARVTGNPQVNVITNTTNRKVTINGSVYGGGSAAPVTGNPLVTIRGNDTDDHKVFIGNYVFGGGLGSTAVLTGDTSVNIFGNTEIGKNVYGGGNGGLVEGTTNVTIGDCN